MNKNTFKYFVGIILVAMISIILWLNNNKDDDKKLKVGFVIAMSGYGATFGKAESNAVQLLKEKYPDIEFIIADNRSDPNAGLSATRMLIDVNKVSIIYCDLTTVANAIVPVTNRSGVILIASVYLNNLLDRSPLTLRNLPTAEEEAQLVINHLLQKEYKLQRVVAIGSNDEFGRGSLVDFKQLLSRKGGNLVSELIIPENEQQIFIFSRKVLEYSPDALYLASLRPSLGLTIKALRENGYKGPIMTTDAYAYDYIRDAAGEYGTGIFYADFKYNSEDKKIIQKYEKTFGEKFSPAALLVHSSISFVLNKISKEKTVDGNAIMSMLQKEGKKTDTEGVRLVNREFKYPLIVKVSK